MGFYIDVAEMKKAVQDYQKKSTTAQEQLDTAKTGMNGIITSNAMQGQVGEAITADINNNQNTVIVGLKDSYKLAEADMIQAYTEFQSSTGETSDSAILSQEALGNVKKEIDTLKTTHKELEQSFKTIYNNISDLVSLSMPKSDFENVADEAKAHIDNIITKVTTFDSVQTKSSTEDIISALKQQIVLSEQANGLSYTDPNFLVFATSTELADSIQTIDTQLTEMEKEAKLQAEKAAKEKQAEWEKYHPLENFLQGISDNIGSWWNGIVEGTKGLNTHGLWRLKVGKNLLQMLESAVSFAGAGFSDLIIGSVQLGELLGGTVGNGIKILLGDSPNQLYLDDLNGTIKNIQALTPSNVLAMSKAAIGSMADDYKRGDVYAMTYDALTVGTLLYGLKGAVNGVKSAKSASKVGAIADDLSLKKASGASKAQKVENFQNRIDNIRNKMPNSKLKNQGNMAVADVQIKDLPDEFMAHSKIHGPDSKGADLGNFSHASENKIFESYTIDKFPRYNDTEVKILEDIASKIKDPNISGKIDLYTELPACQSCTNVILEFRNKFPNIELNIFTK